MENIEFLKSKFTKSFIKVGKDFLDIKECISFNFTEDEDGYVFGNFLMYGKPKSIKIKIANKNELSFLFLQLDNFFEDPALKVNLQNLMKDIDNLKKKK